MFFCETCNCYFQRNSVFKKHLLSLKHAQRLGTVRKHQCQCGKWYMSYSSLSTHRKKCKEIQAAEEPKKVKFLEEQVKLQKQQEQELEQEEECENLDIEKELDNDSLCDVKLKLAQLSEKVEELNARCKTIDGKRISQKSTRKPTKQIRIDVYNKQNKQCNMCKVELNDVWQLDHCVALQFGGEDNIENLQALCCQCHATKSIQENKKRKEIKDAIQTILQR